MPAGAAAAATAAATATAGSPAVQVKPPNEFTAHIASISRNAAGRAVVTLDNGQVWRQSETRASFEASAGDAVTISSGVLGSYWLVTSVHNRTRVERVR